MKKIMLIITLLSFSNIVLAVTGQDDLEQQPIDQKATPLHIGNPENEKQQQQRIDQINDQARQHQEQQQKIDQMNGQTKKVQQQERQTRALEKSQQFKWR